MPILDINVTEYAEKIVKEVNQDTYFAWKYLREAGIRNNFEKIEDLILKLIMKDLEEVENA